MEAFLKPMLCPSGSVDVVPEGEDWVLEGKWDGWRAIVHVNGIVKLYGGRNGSEYSGKLPYIESVLHAILPPDSAVDGELIGTDRGHVQGVMTRGHGAHVPSAYAPALSYVLFDITRLNGEDLRSKPWRERRDHLDVLQIAIDLHSSDSLIRLSPYGPSSDAMHREMLKLGLEGSVCKRVSGRYVNARSPLWVKIKPKDTADGEIIGFKPATPGSKYDGNAIGAIKFRLPSGYEGEAGGGISDAQREEMYEHPERFIGRTIEISHLGVQAKTGALLSPNFLCFRDDKDPRPARPKAAPRVERKPAGGASGRNYGSMGAPKLLAAIESLKAKSGDAYERCIAKDGDPEVDLGLALAAAASKGLL